MATIKKVFATPAVIMSAVAVTTGSDSSDVDMETNGYEGAHLTVDADNDGGTTDDLLVEVFGSLDGTNYDDTPMFSQIIDTSTSTDPNQISIVVKDVAHWRISCSRTGSTDTINVTATVKPWNWNSA